ncbi:MAG: hypothetical protein ABR524_13305, partial [Thermoanaerobaculia bacterium]
AGVRRIVALRTGNPDRQGRPERMTPRSGATIAVLTGLLLFGCAEKAPVNDGSHDGTAASRGEVVRIVFDLPGDDIGSQEDQVLLDALRDAVAAGKAGEIMSSGFGMGTMELVVAIDRRESIEVLRQIVDEVSPGSKGCSTSVSGRLAGGALRGGVFSSVRCCSRSESSSRPEARPSDCR